MDLNGCQVHSKQTNGQNLVCKADGPIKAEPDAVDLGIEDSIGMADVDTEKGIEIGDGW